MAVNVRFVLTGSCHPYSGRQVLFALPLASSADSPTTIADVKAIIRRCWPAGELPAVAPKIAATGLKVLKNGRLLSDEMMLRDVLTAQEQSESATQAHTWGTGFDDSAQSVSNTVLMHLVFHSNPPPQPLLVVVDHAKTRRTSVESDTSCGCCVM